jgi:hypothetical protein
MGGCSEPDLLDTFEVRYAPLVFPGWTCVRELPVDEKGKTADLAIFETGTEVANQASLYWLRRRMGGKGRPGPLRTSYGILSDGRLRGRRTVVIEAKCRVDSDAISKARGQVLNYSGLLAANYGCMVVGKGLLFPKGALTDEGVRKDLGRNGIYVYEVDVPSKSARKRRDGTKGPLDWFLDPGSGP